MKQLLVYFLTATAAFMLTACGRTEKGNHEETTGQKCEVEAYAVVPFDSIRIAADDDFADVLPLRYSYTPDEAGRIDSLFAMNDSLMKAKGYSYQWISYTKPERKELVVIPDEPLLRQNVEITSVDTIPENDVIQIAFRFNDKKEWEEITTANIGRRIAIFVDGKLLNAPQVNMTITQGACAVTVPLDEAAEMLPDAIL